MSNPIDDLITVVSKAKEQGWKENPILVPAELEERAKAIAKENQIPVLIKGVVAKWKKK